MPLPLRIRCSDEARPPAARTGTSAPSGPARKVRGPRFETTMVSPAPPLTRRSTPVGARTGGARTGGARTGDAFERGPQHVDGLGPQLVQRPVAVDALAQVDLGQAVGPQALGDVDQQAELDPVAGGEAELLEDPAVGRRLAGQGLAHPGELGEEQLEHRAGDQFGDPPAAGRVTVQRAGVEALHERHVLGGEQRPEQPGDEGRRRVGHVGIEEGHDVAGGGRERGGHGLALAAGAARADHDPGPGVPGLLGGVVASTRRRARSPRRPGRCRRGRPGTAARPPARPSRRSSPRPGPGCTPRRCGPPVPWPRGRGRWGSRRGER